MTDATVQNVILQTVPERTKNKSKPQISKSKSYAEDTLSKALASIRQTAMPLYAASKVYGIPRTTLQYRLSSEYRNKGSKGPYTVFSAKEERDIVIWLHEMERKGFPITQNSLTYKISCYLKANPRPTPFKDNTPGKSWFKLFLKRHPDLSLRTPEGVTAASSKVSEKDIRNWFQTVYNYLQDNNLTDVLNDPARILNGDETGFCLNPVPKQVIAMKGKKDVSFIETASSKQNITVMFSFAANGSVIPPDVILNQKRPSRDVLRAFPGDWGIGTSDNGWMNTPNFVAYIKKILYPALVKRDTTFPVVYFVDGHSSHTAFEAADACKQLGIIMIALYPNATRILQPADVAIFRPLKNSWGKVVDAWRSDHPSEKITLTTFGPLLEKAMKLAFKTSTIMNGFAVCGLYPFNANAVDYAKCLGKSAAGEPDFEPCDPAYDTGVGDFETCDPAYDTGVGDFEPCDPAYDTGVDDVTTEIIADSAPVQKHVAVPEEVLQMATRMLGPSKINLYLSKEANDFSHEDQVLSYIYKNILVLGDSSEHDDFQQAAVGISHVDVPGNLSSANCHDDSNDRVEQIFEDADLNIAEVSGETYTVEANEVLTEATESSLHVFETASENFGKSAHVSSELETFEVVTQGSESLPHVFGNLGEAGDVSGEEYAVDTIEVLTEATVTPLADVTNQRLERKSSISGFLISPPTPKRNPEHRNYVNRTNLILTAAERLEELRIFEEKKIEAVEQKKKRAEMREVRKKEKEKAKQEAAERRTEKALKRKAENEKKLAEKNMKKLKRSKVLI